MEKSKEERTKLFIDSYMRTNNAASAARSAGYSSKSAAAIGYKLLQREDIKTEIERRKEKIDRKADSARILSIIEIQQELSRIALDDDRKDQDRLRALELLGKAKGLFVERSEVVTTEAPEAFKALTMDQLKELVKRTEVS